MQRNTNETKDNTMSLIPERDGPIDLAANVEAALRTIILCLPETKPGKDYDDDVYMIHAFAKRLLERQRTLPQRIIDEAGKNKS
jgi:hypothetical protein